jgi:hypothetical protein
MTNSLNPTHLVQTGLDLLAASTCYFTRMNHMLQEQNKNEKKCAKRGQEEEKGITTVPLFRKT